MMLKLEKRTALKFFFNILLAPMVSSLGPSCKCPFDETGESVSIASQFQIHYLKEFNDLEGTLKMMATLTLKWHDSCAWQLAEQTTSPSRIALGLPVQMETNLLWKPFIIASDQSLIWEDSQSIPIQVDNDLDQNLANSMPRYEHHAIPS